MEEVKSTVRETIQRLYSFMEHSDWTLRGTARGIGCSKSTLHLFMRGKYTGDVLKLERKINEFLTKKNNNKHNSIFSESLFVKTSVSQKIFDVAELCKQYRDIGVITGQAGYGKSRAIDEYCNLNPDDTVLLQCDPGYKSRALFNELHNKVFGYYTHYSTHHMFTAIKENLQEKGRMIVVDESEYAAGTGIDLLRRLHDKAGVPVLLVGLPRLLANLRGAENRQLYSRIGFHLALPPLQEVDTKAIVQSMLPDTGAEYKHFFKEARGNTRRLVKLIVRAKNVAEINNTDITKEVVKVASEMLII